MSHKLKENFAQKQKGGRAAAEIGQEKRLLVD